MAGLDLPQDFEDCEIRSISFDHPNVIVKLFDSFEVNYYTLKFSGAEFVLFESDHVQNVMSRIFSFQNVDEAIKQRDFLKFASDRGILEAIRNRFGNYKICYFYPVTSGDMVICYSQLDIEMGMGATVSS